MSRHLPYSLFITSLICCVLLFGEFLLLPAMSGLDRKTLLMGFAAKPGTEIDGQLINGMGFTGDDITQEKPAGSVRILLLGGSVLFNRHMSERMKPMLEKTFSGSKVELVNAGLRSHTTRSSLLKMQLLAGYHFDYVLVYHGINDLWANHITPDGFRQDYAHLNSWYERSWLLDHSTLARSVFNLWRARNPLPAPQYIFPEKPYINLCHYCSVQSFSDNLQQVIELANDSGAQVILATFASSIPTDYSRKRFLAGEMEYVNPDNYDRRDVFNWGPPAYVSEGIRQHNEALKALASRNSLPLWDAAATLDNEITLFGDACHFNDDGVERFIAGFNAFLTSGLTATSEEPPGKPKES